jgi:hypothetical protein
MWAKDSWPHELKTINNQEQIIFGSTKMGALTTPTQNVSVKPSKLFSD